MVDETGVDEFQPVVVPAADVQRHRGGDPAIEHELAVVLDDFAGGVEGFGCPGGFDHHIRAEAVGQILDGLDDVVLSGVEGDVRAEAAGEGQLALKHVHHDDAVRALALGALGDDLPGEAAAHDHHGVPKLHPTVQAGIHGAGDGLAQRGDVHVEIIGHGLELEGLGGEIFGEVVVPAEGHDLVPDLVVGYAAAHGDDRAAALVPQQEGEFGVLPEFGGFRGQVAAVEVLVGTADAHEVVLDDDVVLAADKFALDKLDVAGPVEAGGLGDESFHVRSFMTERGGDGFDAFPPFPCHAALHGALGETGRRGEAAGPAHWFR